MMVMTSNAISSSTTISDGLSSKTMMVESPVISTVSILPTPSNEILVMIGDPSNTTTSDTSVSLYN